MARLQSLIQLHSLERSVAPISTRMLGGISGVSEGVPKMHPLKSSNPVFKGAALMHGLRIKKFHMPKIRMGLKMPSLRMPHL